jgi:hypothetical protein
MTRTLAAALCAALAAGCAAGQPAPAPEPPAFQLSGSRIIACCCGTPCPCRLNKKPMHCHGCDHTDAVRVDRGHVGPVKMDGVTWIIAGRGFGEDPAKNWVVVYLDEKASPEQEKALTDMLGADLKAWGPKAKHLAGAFKGVTRVPMTYTVSADRREYSAVIPGRLELRTRAIVNPGHKDPVVSTGIMDAFGDRFVHAEPVVHKYEDKALGYAWDLSGRQANFADFVLTPERVGKGAIGWGCWTAHSDYDDKGKYLEQMKDDHK